MSERHLQFGLRSHIDAGEVAERAPPIWLAVCNRPPASASEHYHAMQRPAGYLPLRRAVARTISFATAAFARCRLRRQAVMSSDVVSAERMTLVRRCLGAGEPTSHRLYVIDC